MARRPAQSDPGWWSLWALLTIFLSLCPQGRAQGTQTATEDGVLWVQYTGNDGTVWLRDDRRPALYTQEFGDCQGDSLINVTRFDAAYYKDNMTVQFHLGGNSALANEDIMLYIGVYAYGENRFNLTFNPCRANIHSLCPMNSSVPIEANGVIPVAQADVANIPSIALTIPDFEGQAILRVFANSTQSQIGCFSAVINNGASFSHPAAVGSILGVFAFVALASSVAVAIYGHGVSDTRKHYAHSLSVLLVFAIFQHIFFTGGLSMNWPSVLVAFWSNYAWSAGMIYSESMQNTINNFIGSNRGNISMVGSAPSGQNNIGLGGGFELSQIYKRSPIPFQEYDGIGSTLRSRELEHTLMRRQLVNSSSGFSWYGAPVRPGLPLPGNFSGFAGTLGQLNIPASNAFLTGFLWLLILLACVIGGMILLKGVIEGLYAVKVMKTERLSFYRRNWIGFTAATVLRAWFIAFFMMTYLTLFQSTFGGATNVLALAGVVFTLFVVSMFGLAAYALWHRLRYEKLISKPGRLDFAHKSKSHLRGYHVSTKKEVKEPGSEPSSVAISLPWWQLHFTDTERPHVHDDEDYTIKFGWLSSRFRRSKWWFFSFWLVYELVRACFYGAAAGHALTQVFGLLAWEILAFIAIVKMKPFESNRLNLLMVYLLGFSKVATVALASAFDERFGLDRILTTVIGVIIIVIQGLLTICLMIAIVLGAISSYMSITRYRTDIKPESWLPHRDRYFAHMDLKATDKPAPRPPTPPRPETPKEPYFSVTAVRREPKIEDEDSDEVETEEQMQQERRSIEQNGERLQSRTMSMRSRASTSMSNLPYGARKHRASWSTRDFQNAELEEKSPSGLDSRMSLESMHGGARGDRASSLRGPSRTGTEMSGNMVEDKGVDGAAPRSPRGSHRRTLSGPLQRSKGKGTAEEKDHHVQLVRERTNET